MNLTVSNVTCNSLDVRVLLGDDLEGNDVGAVLILVVDGKGDQQQGALVEFKEPGLPVSHDIHFLVPDSSYLVKAVALKRDPVTEWTMIPSLSASPVPVTLPPVPCALKRTRFDGRGYVGRDHLPGLWILKVSGNGDLWTDCVSDPEFLRRQFAAALFVLPVSSGLGVIVSPAERYCIDFRLRRQQRTQRAFRQFLDGRCRKVLQQCCVKVNQDFVGSLRMAARRHVADRGSTWITEPLIQALDQVRLMQHCPPSDSLLPLMKTVELRDRSSGELRAVVCGFALGRVFHEYTTATVGKKNEDPAAPRHGYGTCLTKILLHALDELEFDLDYWGYKLDYFFNFDKYGGVEIGVDEFWPRWTASSRQPGPDSLDQFLESM